MTKEFIIEGKKIIIEFMGLCLQPDEYNGDKDIGEIMKVVEKIESLTPFFGKNPYTVYIRRNICTVHDGYEVLIKVKSPTKALAIFGAVVDFIKWHNKRSSEIKGHGTHTF